MTEETGIVTNLIVQTGAMLKGAAERIRRSVLCRFAMIGAIVLAMLVPMSMVEDVVSERGGRHRAVLAEIAGLWGHQQSLIGPILVLPYREKIVAEKQAIDKLGRWKKTDEIAYRERTAIALPATLDLDMRLETTQRSRGIYEALVYGADVSLKAAFAKPEIAKLVDEEVEFEVDWNKAYLAVGLSDMHAIKEVTTPTWAGEPVRVAPATRLDKLLKSGFHVPLEAWTGEGERFEFTLALKLNGSNGFSFAPVAERTEARIASNWPHPSFQGTTLPASHRIDKAGFEATWRIPALARGLPWLWSLGAERHRLAGFSTGVVIAEPVHLYAKVERAVKYAILYVALTFLAFLVFELLLGARLHLVQYGLVGLALSLFYLTLLSLAEHIAFGAAYLAAAAVIVVMIAGYAWAALRSRSQAAIAAVALSALYAVLYTILRMEDFALLAGTGLLILVTALLMLVTRNLGRANAPAAEAAG